MSKKIPADWPQAGPIDLAVHDLPHRSAATEWWYVNTHLHTSDHRSISIFASFFRIVKAQDEVTKELHYAHSITWAYVDADARKYHAISLVDKDAPRLALDKLEQGEGTPDQRLRRAMREILEKGHVPYPDRMFKGDVHVGARRLALELDGQRFCKRDDNCYELELYNERERVGCNLVLRPRRPPIRHGEDGIVDIQGGETMFYYFIPKCDVTGTVTINAVEQQVLTGTAWYDHEFGGKQEERRDKRRDIGWNWCALQLDNGFDVTAAQLVDCQTGELLNSKVIVVDREHRRHLFPATISFANVWRSTRTFNEYPTHWHVDAPDGDLSLDIDGVFDDQEFVTLISKPAFWEGRVEVSGRVLGETVKGLGFIERSGFDVVETLDDFFKQVGKEVRKSVQSLLPFNPTFAQVRDMIASPEREQQMVGVDSEKLVRTMCKPVREITDRGGKSWRSYAALACCDVVGGDSRDFVRWLAMPELMHVGSLIVDDVQDRSTVRRGGPPAHVIYGEALAINAGTACYFMGQRLLSAPTLSSADKLKLYDLYFEALRAGHAGQALDLGGFDDIMPQIVETGDGRLLEEQVLAVHRLKTAAPAGALARMGGIAGGGSAAQIDGVGRFFEAVGLAFQIVDDVLNLSGFERDLKQRGEDISQGKVTLPVAKAMSLLGREEREWLWETLRQQSQDPAIVGSVVDRLEACGALAACSRQARELVDDAWQRLDPLVEDSMPKIMLRSFGWYVLERHY
ncbi:MAG: polyprenyl synthetase family protein [Candidatus Schekmanbacteria bacterium]|nr:polyprenyl synthetase family protein [Candidatus Schekmanbacteria bacterium]